MPQVHVPGLAPSPFGMPSAQFHAEFTREKVEACAEAEDVRELCESEIPILRIPPTKGAAVLFYSVTPDGFEDPAAVHAGCHVPLGESKWVAQVWARDTIQDVYPANL